MQNVHPDLPVNFQQLVDSLDLAVIATDLTGKITYWSKGAERLYGFKEEEVLEKNIAEVTSRDISQKEADLIFKSLQNGESWQGEFEVQKKDRKLFTAYVINSPILDSQGKLIGIIGASRDITSVKQAEDELERDKAKDEAILASLGQGMVVVDKEGKIILVNKSFTELLGWIDTEVIGKPMGELVPKEDEAGNRAQFNELILTKVLKGEKFVADLINPYYFVTKDGSRFPVSMIVSPIKLNGEIIGAVETFRDITREKEIDKAKSEFVSLASHQLRTPLSTINWYVETLKTDSLGPTNEKQKKYLDEVYFASQRMVNLVNALLNVSRIEMGTFMIEPQEVDIAGLTEDILKEVLPIIVEKKLIVDKKFDFKLPTIKADPKLLTIVLQNLITNSVKYTPIGGQINIEIKVEDSEIVIKVSDSGCGIPESAKSKIFTKLFRADNVRELESVGTGLGLYITKAIIEQTKGKIWFESEENKGTTFYVTLPLSGMQKKEGYKALN